jgi:hypothetical protein
VCATRQELLKAGLRSEFDPMPMEPGEQQSGAWTEAKRAVVTNASLSVGCGGYGGAGGSGSQGKAEGGQHGGDVSTVHCAASGQYVHPELGFKKHGNGTHPICFLFKCVSEVLAVGFRGNRLKLLRFLAGPF